MLLLLYIFLFFVFSSCLLFYMVDKVDNIQRWVASQEEKLSVGGGSVGGAPLEFFFFLTFYFLSLQYIFSVCGCVCVCVYTYVYTCVCVCVCVCGVFHSV